MSDLTLVNPEVLDFTAQERKQINDLCRKHTRISKIVIYLAWRSESYKDLNYSSFDLFCEEWLETPRRTVTRWLSQVESTMHVMNLQPEKLGQLALNLQEIKLLPSLTTDELHKLPTPELQREAYEQMQSIRQDGAHSADYQQGVKIIVSQLLEANTPKQIPAPPVVSETPARSPFSSPPSAERAPSVPTSASSPATLGRSSVSLPTNVSLGKTVTRQPVPSFSPSPDDIPPDAVDEFFETPECPDPEELRVCFDLALTWAQNGSLNCTLRNRQRSLATICAFMEWAKAQQ